MKRAAEGAIGIAGVNRIANAGLRVFGSALNAAQAIGTDGAAGADAGVFKRSAGALLIGIPIAASFPRLAGVAAIATSVVGAAARSEGECGERERECEGEWCCWLHGNGRILAEVALRH